MMVRAVALAPRKCVCIAAFKRRIDNVLRRRTAEVLSFIPCFPSFGRSYGGQVYEHRITSCIASGEVFAKSDRVGGSVMTSTPEHSLYVSLLAGKLSEFRVVTISRVLCK